IKSKVVVNSNTIYTSKLINYVNRKSSTNEIDFDNHISIKNVVINL
ncbi:605_t:CDS:1, partial [Gigaspora margarita]